MKPLISNILAEIKGFEYRTDKLSTYDIYVSVCNFFVCLRAITYDGKYVCRN
jgi:hypothetical protein